MHGNNDSLVNIALRLAKCFYYGLGTEINLSLTRLYIKIADVECEFWRKMKNVYGYTEFHEIKRLAREINRS